MANLITIQVTDAQLAQLQCLVAESAEDANLLEQALAVPIPVASRYDPKICRHGLAFDMPCYECNPPTAEQKYCAHCDGGISERSQRIAEMPQMRRVLSRVPEWLSAWVLSTPNRAIIPTTGKIAATTRQVCDKCGKRKWDPMPQPIQADDWFARARA